MVYLLHTRILLYRILLYHIHLLYHTSYAAESLNPLALQELREQEDRPAARQARERVSPLDVPFLPKDYRIPKKPNVAFLQNPAVDAQTTLSDPSARHNVSMGSEAVLPALQAAPGSHAPDWMPSIQRRAAVSLRPLLRRMRQQSFAPINADIYMYICTFKHTYHIYTYIYIYCIHI